MAFWTIVSQLFSPSTLIPVASAGALPLSNRTSDHFLVRSPGDRAVFIAPELGLPHLGATEWSPPSLIAILQTISNDEHKRGANTWNDSLRRGFTGLHSPFCRVHGQTSPSNSIVKSKRTGAESQRSTNNRSMAPRGGEPSYIFWAGRPCGNENVGQFQKEG